MPIDGDQTGPQRVPFPIGGAANASAFRDQPTRFAPPETLRNVRPFDTSKDRPRLGMSPGIAKLFNQVFGNGGPIQWVGTVSRASVVAGYHLGPHSDITGRSAAAGVVAGQTFAYAPGNPPLLSWFGNIDLTGEGGPGTISVVSVARHPTTDMVVVATDAYSNGSDPHEVARVVAYDRYGVQVWSTKLSNASADVFINEVAVSRLYTFVATNGKVAALRNDTGAVVETSTCNSWADEVVSVKYYQNTVSGAEYIFALFNGKTTSVTLPNGASVTSGFYAKSFRSGVMKFLVPSANYAQTPVFTQVQWGRQLPSSDAYYEASHGYFRISENSALKPRGAIVNDMAVDSAGNVYIARCNCGGGPNNSFTPSLLLVRPITVCKVSAAGVMQWEMDTDSIVRVGSQGVLNDIPTAGGIEPSIQAVAVDSDNGALFVAGAPNAALQCVFRLNNLTGAIQWSRHLIEEGLTPERTIRQGCIRVDPSDSNLILGGDQSTDWSAAIAAHLWKLQSVSGEVEWYVNLATVSSLGLCVFPDGRFITTTDEF